MEFNIVELILDSFDPTLDYHYKMKDYLEDNQDYYNEFIYNNPNYKDKVIYLECIFKHLKSDLLREVFNALVYNKEIL